MVHALPSPSRTRRIFAPSAKEKNAPHLSKNAYRGLIFLAALVLLSPFLFAQNNPQVTGVDPASGKVNDDITIAGENLGKATVVAVFLSDDKTDYKATIVDQSAEKIVMKVPQVKAGTYNISVQVGTNILIKPVKFTVQE
jgi:hypothetical protein